MIRRRNNPRRGPLRDPRYLDYLRDRGCCAGSTLHNMRAVEAAHGPVNGMSSKGPDDEAIPLCHKCHVEQTAIGWDAFERRHNFSRATVAANWRANYQKYIALVPSGTIAP